MTVLESILHNRIIAILRGADPAHVLEIAHALYGGGVRLMEITLNSRDAVKLIDQLCRHMPGDMLIGAGTVLDQEGATVSIDAGARFLISPMVDEELIGFTKRREVISIPGAYTPTEVVKGYKAGGDIIKLFPSSNGIQYFKDIRAPLDHIPLMPTGGIDENNIASFRNAGAVAFGIGSALYRKPAVFNQAYLDELTLRASKLKLALEA